MTIFNLSYNQNEVLRNEDSNNDPSLNSNRSPSLSHKYDLSESEINKRFLSKLNLEYISDYAFKKQLPFRVVTHPEESNTCYEKARLLGDWDPLNVIKALYFECPVQKLLYAVVVPETGCFVDRGYITSLLDLPQGVTLAKAKNLPKNMSYGTCSPFISPDDTVENGGAVAKIIFDSETLVAKKHENNLDDFSFGIDHHFSLQLNYYHCYKLLSMIFNKTVIAEEILTLNFTEIFQRKNGKIKLNYNFKSINYRTAKFINNIHGVGDVTVENDYVDELDLPDVLTIT